jgi:drug/metabolite transporter (DMT)-like permease
VFAAGPSLHQLGIGILLVGLGIVLAAYGAYAGRRFTTWVWAAAIPIGAVVIVDKELHNNTAGAGITLLVAGVVLVGAATGVAAAIHEGSDDDDVAADGERSAQPAAH